jgi:hypothetical protein
MPFRSLIHLVRFSCPRASSATRLPVVRASTSLLLNRRIGTMATHKNPLIDAVIDDHQEVRVLYPEKRAVT